MNSELLEKIINIMEEIFDCYCFLNVDMSSISKIEKLKMDEEKYISFLPKRISSLDEISIAVRNNYHCESSVKKHFVMDRFDSFLELLKKNVEDSNISKDLLDEEFYDSYQYNNLINKKIITDLINEINDCKLKYFLVYSNIEIENELIKKGFNVNNLGSISDDDLKSVIKNSFNDLYEEVLNIHINRLLFEIITLYNNNDSDVLVSYNLEILKLLLKKLSDSSLKLLKSKIKSSNLISDNKLKEELLSYFSNVDFIYDDNEDLSIEKNLDIDIFNRLVNLIKFEEVILSRYDDLDLSDKKSISTFMSLLDYEKEIIDSIVLYDDASKYVDIILNDSYFFFNDQMNDRKVKLIGNRIFNYFPDFKELFNDMSIESYDLVVSNHIVNSLYDYRIKMCELSSEMFNKYVNTYKDILFIYPSLLNDVIYLNCDFTALFSFDDDMCSNILNIGSDRSIVYSYDKDIILYEIGKKIIFDLENIVNLIDDNPDLISLYEFKICEFNDIINNISLEHLYALEDDAENVSNSEIKSVLMNHLSLLHRY